MDCGRSTPNAPGFRSRRGEREGLFSTRRRIFLKKIQSRSALKNGAPPQNLLKQPVRRFGHGKTRSEIMKRNNQWTGAGLLLVVLGTALCGCKQQSSAASASSTNQMAAPASQTATNASGMNTNADPATKLDGTKTNVTD
jgi:hypothetical protein